MLMYFIESQIHIIHRTLKPSLLKSLHELELSRRRLYADGRCLGLLRIVPRFFADIFEKFDLRIFTILGRIIVY